MQSPKKILTLGKAKEAKWLGVCQGYSDYFKVDVSSVRLICLALVFLTGFSGVFMYLILYAILPKHPMDKKS